jgi:hypothetical protein
MAVTAIVAISLGVHAEVEAESHKAHVVLSFVIIGCNRVNGADVSPDNPSTANLAQLERSFAEIAALKPRPKFVFFTGDMVFGLNSDLGVLRSQLESWLDVYRSTPLGDDPRIRLIVLPGNHESLVGAKGSQRSNPGAEDVWLSVMQQFIAGNNGPGVGGPDNLQSDQSELTYSFNFKHTHFVIVNTDPFGAVATVPTHWIGDDLAAAHGKRHLKHIFVIGHKPAFPPFFSSAEQSLNSNPDNRNAFWDEMNANGVDAYLVAHCHVWDLDRPVSPDDPSARKVYQVVAGNGGTPLDPGWNAVEPSPYFGFTLVQIDSHDRVTVTSYGRDYDHQSYLAPSPPSVYPTTVRMSIGLSM